MTATPSHDLTGTPPAATWLRRLCARLGGWCDHLLDAHHSRIPF